MDDHPKPKRIGQILHEKSFDNWKKVSAAIGESQSSLVSNLLAALTPDEARALYDRGAALLGDTPRTTGKASAVAKSVRQLKPEQLEVLMKAAADSGITL